MSRSDDAPNPREVHLEASDGRKPRTEAERCAYIDGYAKALEVARQVGIAEAMRIGLSVFEAYAKDGLPDEEEGDDAGR